VPAADAAVLGDSVAAAHVEDEQILVDSDSAGPS
jgi:hypothetical protein